MADNKPELQRGLEARQIQLIALGTIGVGLLNGAAPEPRRAGPSVLLAYIIAWAYSVFFIMRSMAKRRSLNRLPVRSPFMRIVI
ncbi:hypothetical protein ACLK1S_23560 [Escherichia coli]